MTAAYRRASLGAALSRIFNTDAEYHKDTDIFCEEDHEIQRWASSSISGDRFDRYGHVETHRTKAQAVKSLEAGVFDGYPSAPMHVIDLDTGAIYDCYVKVNLRRWRTV